MILEPPKLKSDTVSTVSPSISHEVMGPDAMIFSLGLEYLKLFCIFSVIFKKNLEKCHALDLGRDKLDAKVWWRTLSARPPCGPPILRAPVLPHQRNTQLRNSPGESMTFCWSLVRSSRDQENWGSGPSPTSPKVVLLPSSQKRSPEPMAGLLSTSGWASPSPHPTA